MKSKRVVGLGLAGLALVAAAACLVWDHCPACHSTAKGSAGIGDPEDAPQDPAATIEMAGSEAADSKTDDEARDSDESAQVDFSGIWQLDVEASDPGDPIFTAI